MDAIYVPAAAFGGAIVSSLLGYVRSGASFAPRKFLASFLRAIIAGGAFAGTYAVVGGEPGIVDIIAAFGAGAGADVLLHRLAPAK